MNRTSETLNKYVPRDGGTLLPIIKVPQVESTMYVLRLTPLDKYNFQDAEVFIKGLTDTYAMSKEQSKKDKEHYHIVLEVSKTESELREDIRTFLKQYFTEKAKRGDANKQYNLQECLDFEQAIKYLLKDGGELSFGTNIDEVALNARKKLSYAKYSKAEFAKELEDIKEKFKANRWELNDMMVAIVKLKAKYRQPINMTYIHQLSLSCYIHNNPNYSYTAVEKYLERVNF